MRAVLDKNVIVSRYLSPKGSPTQILKQWRWNAFDLVVSEAILREYQETLLYKHIQAMHQRNAHVVERIVANFRKLSILVEPSEEVDVITSDPDDNKFLAYALTGCAEVIVSGDSDLLSLKQYQGIHILPPHTFLMFLEQEKAA
jgi:putative PIN family toxin of toxin-antitoxin system